MGKIVSLSELIEKTVKPKQLKTSFTWDIMNYKTSNNYREMLFYIDWTLHFLRYSCNISFTLSYLEQLID
ncbi:hypothetical protein [Metabacillus malikii]|uniref:Uncharacterized protein n=1 Tax=Metabacillus malikii TaxID=1504265 RepID=A0ABT9ZDK5_9BACI|nr:hypothetical protein [Metabacillus malikii]MDQ0230350.1 hypothetical protein [Metabacillus malikii]